MDYFWECADCGVIENVGDPYEVPKGWVEESSGASVCPKCQGGCS